MFKTKDTITRCKRMNISWEKWGEMGENDIERVRKHRSSNTSCRTVFLRCTFERWSSLIFFIITIIDPQVRRKVFTSWWYLRECNPERLEIDEIDRNLGANWSPSRQTYCVFYKDGRTGSVGWKVHRLGERATSKFALNVLTLVQYATQRGIGQVNWEMAGRGVIFAWLGRIMGIMRKKMMSCVKR